jgi:hypothetical protein
MGVARKDKKRFLAKARGSQRKQSRLKAVRSWRSWRLGEKPVLRLGEKRFFYFTETVTPCWLWLPPKLTTMG